MPKIGALEERVSRLENIFGRLLPSPDEKPVPIIERMQTLHQDHKDLGNGFLRLLRHERERMQGGVDSAVARVDRCAEQALSSDQNGA